MMPLTSVDTMLENMMMQMLKPDQNASINGLCCKCFKTKKIECQRSGDRCCKCRKNGGSRKQKKGRRKPKKSCLKTLICLTKMAKDGCGHQPCQGCSCAPNVMESTCGIEDERFCSKCGQLLPGMELSHQTLNQFEGNQQEPSSRKSHTDMGVQVNIQRQEPLSVHIKVCPCPNMNLKSHDIESHHSASVPELSSTDPRLVDDPTPDNLHGSKRLHFKEDDPHVSLNDSATMWPLDTKSIKQLALNIAKARMVEESACWEKEYARRCLQMNQQREMREQTVYEPPLTNTDDNIDVDQYIKGENDGMFNRRSVAYKEEQIQNNPRTVGLMSQKSRTTNTYYNSTNNIMNCDEILGTARFVESGIPRQDMSSGCCADTSAYCYSPENPTLIADNCDYICTCTCGSAVQYHPQPFFGNNSKSYQDYGRQERFRRAPSPCR